MADPLPSSQEPRWTRDVEQFLRSELTQFDEILDTWDRGEPIFLEFPTSTIIAQTLLRELKTELYYEFDLGDLLSHQVQYLSETHQSVILETTIKGPNSTRTYYSLVTKEEVVMDLRWWMIATLEEPLEFQINTVNHDDIMTDMLSNTPNKWRHVLREQFEEATAHDN